MEIFEYVFSGICIILLGISFYYVIIGLRRAKIVKDKEDALVSSMLKRGLWFSTSAAILGILMAILDFNRII